MIARYMVASVFAHVAVLTLPAWPTPAPRTLAAPPLRVTLQHPAAPNPAIAADVEKTTRASTVAPIPFMAKAGRPSAEPAETTAVSTAPAGEAERLNHLQTLLRGALDRHFVYPPLARRHGWQGQVKLAVELNAEGRLQRLRVLRSSGYAILDHDALATLARIGALPEARVWLAGRGYQLELPVIYRLIEG